MAIEPVEASGAQVLEGRVGILGGSFNPPHVGHALAAMFALLMAPLEHVVVVPVYLHPFAKALSPFDQRLELCRRTFGTLPKVHVTELERELGGESLTLRTVSALQQRYPRARLRLILGSDVIADLPKWHRFDEVERIAPPFFIERRGHSADEGRALLPEVSSSQLRALLAQGDVRAQHYLTPSALEFIRDNGLYQG